MRRYLTPRCLGMHVTLLVLLPAFAWLTWWQYTRATGGNTLSWAYVFLWPAFGVYAVYTWWNLVHDQIARQTGAEGAGRAVPADPVDGRPGSPAPGWALGGRRAAKGAVPTGSPVRPTRATRRDRYSPQTSEEEARLAEYNRYLASLAAEDSEAGSGAAR